MIILGSEPSFEIWMSLRTVHVWSHNSKIVPAFIGSLFSSGCAVVISSLVKNTFLCRLTMVISSKATWDSQILMTSSVLLVVTVI